MASTEAAVSPIEKLCPALLAEIFLRRLEITKTPWGEEERRSPPLPICQTCKFWRDVALAHPQLWDNPLIYFGDCDINDTIDGAVAILKRAGQKGPMDVRISVAFYAKKQLRIPADALPRILHRFAHLIRSLDIYNLPSIHFDKLLPQPTPTRPAPTPLLRSLRAQFNPDGAPRNNTRDFLQAFPWTQLTMLNIGHFHSPSPDATRVPLKPTGELLSRCTRLEECHLRLNCDYAIFDFDPSPKSQVKVLPSLHTLHVRFYDNQQGENVYSHFFDYITVPALKHLHLELDNLVDVSPQKLLLSKQRSALDLESFTVEKGMTAGNLIIFLQNMPSLSQIHMRSVPANTTRQLLDALTVDHAEYKPGLAPGLVDFSLQCGSAQEAVGERVLKMIVSRSRTATTTPRKKPHMACLQKVHVSIPGLSKQWKDDADARSQLALCQDRGMEVVFKVV